MMITPKQLTEPELRFPEFSGDWANKTLKHVVKVNQGLQIPISERLNEPREGAHFYITNEFLKKGASKQYYILNPPSSVLCGPNDILMTRTGNTGIAVTNVAGAFHNNFFKIAYPEYINKYFLYSFLGLHETKSQILRYAGTSTIPDLNHSDFYRLVIYFPRIEEQKKIASFLTSVDTKTEQLGKKKALLEQYKKGMMQKIFSRELRFKDEQGNDFPDWEEKRLGDYCQINPNTMNLPNEFVYIDLESVKRGSLKKENTILRADAPSRAQRLLSKRDVLFQMVRPYQKNNYYFDEDGNYVASTGYAQLRSNGSAMFLYQVIHTNSFVNKVRARCTGTSYPAVNSSDLGEIPIVIPTDRNEQKKIADFLSAIDQKIDIISNELEQAQTFKKGLLQQMFI